MILHYKTRISVRFLGKTATFWEVLIFKQLRISVRLWGISVRFWGISVRLWEVLIFKQLRISVRLWETSTTLCERKKIASHLMKSGHYIDTKLGV